MEQLIPKYNVAGPRYTSYPTVPYWNDVFDYDTWEQTFRVSYQQHKNDGLSIYIHLPFCESMCTFCGCHKRITKNHEVEHPYVQSLLKEWSLYCKIFDEKPLVRELHLGGGTPTFFSAKNLEDLINGIFATARKAADCEMSFEGHPNNTTRQHLETLYTLGFRRVSFGVQDYSEKVQRAIHRIQPYQNVAKVTMLAREIGYTSISHDIIFGLPYQGVDNIVDTIEKTKTLAPDRIAFYSYAHVPWIKGNGQRGFRDEDIPNGEEKRVLYEIGKKLLQIYGYKEIGMDHFALPSDSLYKAWDNGRLHRNFMGYTTSNTKMLVGLGASAIGDSWYGFAQNSKNIEDYQQLLEWNQLPLFKGHILNQEDLILRQHIQNLMCRFETSWSGELYFHDIHSVIASLHEMQHDGLLVIDKNHLKVTPAGKAFVRNICMAFDLRMKRDAPETQLFSMTV
ncbi:oxygen-independent coproporphyrinogen III oxidase [Flavobacterium sp. CYK-4]|uniref:oxygen-independent coproporphyrinogen III oxidase n=1 Tax=Flavobacterium lotistagni TaxID=2709660 RepID=UPI00140767B2|nr:oxygen-independent coproporphyrinogen III oxidase [Flavobacterium lotistagni]NHM07528.1 oxygen-independent coproporphyrinogen III oxidase [Flavobacterium lotistagni]